MKLVVQLNSRDINEEDFCKYFGDKLDLLRNDNSANHELFVSPPKFKGGVQKSWPKFSYIIVDSLNIIKKIFDKYKITIIIDQTLRQTSTTSKTVFDGIINIEM